LKAGAQGQQARAGRFDQLANAGALVARKVIHDVDVAAA
jgi:hypothetical protein